MSETRVLRVSLRDPNEEEITELRRVIGHGGVVRTVSPLDLTPEQLDAEIRRYGPDVVIVNAATGARRAVIDSLRGEFIVAEPIVIEKDADPKWSQRRNVERRVIRQSGGLGMRDERDNLERLSDGELGSRIAAHRLEQQEQTGTEMDKSVVGKRPVRKKQKRLLTDEEQNPQRREHHGHIESERE